MLPPSTRARPSVTPLGADRFPREAAERSRGGLRQEVGPGQPLIPAHESYSHPRSLELRAFVAVERAQSAPNVGAFELVQLSYDSRLTLSIPEGARIPAEVVERSGDRPPAEEAGCSEEPLVKTGMGLGQRPVDEQVGLHFDTVRTPVDGSSRGRRSKPWGDSAARMNGCFSIMRRSYSNKA